jgi:YVTN family beta-propeller protein
MAAGFETFGVAFDPSGMSALVTASGSDQLLVIDVPTRTVIRTVATYRRPRGIAWRSDARRAWITHLLMPEFFGRLSTYFPSTGTIAQILSSSCSIGLRRIPEHDAEHHPAPPPFDNILWIPANRARHGGRGTRANPLTPTNIFHAIRPRNTTTCRPEKQHVLPE